MTVELRFLDNTITLLEDIKQVGFGIKTVYVDANGEIDEIKKSELDKVIVRDNTWLNIIIEWRSDDS